MARAKDKPKYRAYNVQPRYWNPEKEEREEREKRIKAKLGLKDDDDTFIPNIKGKLKAELHNRLASSQAARNKSTVRLFFILIILLIAAYYLIFKYVDIF
jgi:hypothetical protein